MVKAIIAVILIVVGIVLLFLAWDRLSSSGEYFSEEVPLRDTELGKSLSVGYLYLFFGMPLILAGIAALAGSGKGKGLGE